MRANIRKPWLRSLRHRFDPSQASVADHGCRIILWSTTGLVALTLLVPGDLIVAFFAEDLQAGAHVRERNGSGVTSTRTRAMASSGASQ